MRPQFQKEIAAEKTVFIHTLRTLLATWIRRQRQRAGLTKEYLAGEVGVDANTILNWETARTTPKYEKFCTCAQALGGDGAAVWQVLCDQAAATREETPAGKSVQESRRVPPNEPRRLRVTVHRAHFMGISPPVAAYFINITNLSRNREVEVTHVWMNTKPPVAALQKDRLLPKRLKPDEVWETWIEELELPKAYQGKPLGKLGRIRLSIGRVIGSKANNLVARIPGAVPGGPIAKYPEG